MRRGDRRPSDRRKYENIRGAILAEFRQISVCDVLTQHRHDVIATDIVLAIVDAAGGIDGDGQVPAIPTAEVRLARQRRADSNGSFAPLGHFRHGFPADDPALGLKAVVNCFIVSAQGVDRHAGGGPGETARMEAAVERGSHVANYVGTHQAVTLRLRGRGQQQIHQA